LAGASAGGGLGVASAGGGSTGTSAGGGSTGSSAGGGLAGARAGGSGGRQSVRQAWFPEAGGYVATEVIDRQALAHRGSISGPAIIEDPDCTAIVLPGQAARISPAGNLRIEVAAEGDRA
jgi:N-methylhydantoinase A/oxoprolinase/acetone carboxylase beta subunit